MTAIVRRASAYLKLGRVSNLPTVWTNAVGGVVLAGRVPDASVVLGTCTVFSLFYVGGMFLNDAMDRHVDARERPDRPIPSGAVRVIEVFAVGWLLLALGVLGVWLFARTHTLQSPLAYVLSALLVAVIVTYDAWHKGNPIGPLLMAACRMLVYCTAAAMVTGRVSSDVLLGSLVLGSYLVGLTYVAKHEARGGIHNYWPHLFLGAPFVAMLPKLFHGITPAILSVGVYALALGWVVWTLAIARRRVPGSIPRAIAQWIAGISLLDALQIATSTKGDVRLVAYALAAFVLTLVLQRFVRGT